MKNCAFIERTMCSNFIERTLMGLFIKAHAEETHDDDDDDTTTVTGGSTINYEELISKARKEEKAKQYKKIDRLNTQISLLTGQNNENLLKIAELEKKLTDAGSNVELTNLKNQIATLTQEKSDLESEVTKYKSQKPVSREEIESEVRAELEREYTIKTHKATILAEHKDELLIPELVVGNTVEELNASLEAALNRSNQIREQIGATAPKKEKRTPKTQSNPSTSKVQSSEYSLDYIASLDPASEEYREFRKKMGLK